MSLLLKWTKFCVFVLSLLFMGVVIFRQWHQIKEYTFSPDYFLLTLSVLVMLLNFILGAIGWHRIMIALGETHPLKTNIKIWTLSSLTRYLPGGIWGYVSRAALCKEQGIKLSVSMVGLYLETFLLFLSALIIGLPAAISVTGNTIPLTYLLLAGAAGSLLIHPEIFTFIKYFSGRLRKYIEHISLPTVSDMIMLYLYYLVFLTVYGIGFLLFVIAIMPLASDTWLLTASAYPLAFCIGFVLFIFPGGLGIRESVIYVLMLNMVGPTGSIIIAVGSRIWSILVEVIYLAVVYLYINSGTSPAVRNRDTDLRKIT
jgi:hypothetical protein